MKTPQIEVNTPGPWLDDVDNVNSRTIAPYIKINSEHDGVAYAFGRTPQERRANARLIAAAPDLLAELRNVARLISRDSGSPKFTSKQFDRIETLLAKAEGK